MIIPYLLTYLIVRRNRKQKLRRYEIFVTFMIVWLSITILRKFIFNEAIYTLLILIKPIITINYFIRRSTYDAKNEKIDEIL